MLFNSQIFIFIFLPITLAGFFFLRSRASQVLVIGWLVIASLVFYGWWNPFYLIILGGSLLFNYGIGVRLARFSSKSILVFGIAINILSLGYYKYANFFVDSMNSIFSTSMKFDEIVLPLAISFFTFQQIAYLVDAYRGKTTEYKFLQYVLFVTFFPQLIAGPIVHHGEMMPQFALTKKRDAWRDCSIGLTVFALGLFKKVIIADSMARYATPVFDASVIGASMTLFEAWLGVIAYTFQLYFDFSGYSDMAIGLGYMMGIRLPLNFDSPYKAMNIIDFWRRWHITLSRFLREYLYIPLGGNRKGTVRRYINLMITMVLGGLWHGAGWTFVLWGALHGIYLVINHAWIYVRKNIPIASSAFTRFIARSTTFFVVMLAWVFFRSESFSSAMRLLNIMIGREGISFPDSLAGRFSSLEEWGIRFDGMFHNAILEFPDFGVVLCVVLLGIVWYAPNVQAIMQSVKPVLDDRIRQGKYVLSSPITWKPNFVYGLATVLLITASLLVLYIGNSSEFLYYQF